METKSYGIGNFLIGIWIGIGTIDNERHDFLRINLFPFDVYFIFESTSFCLRMHFFHYIRLSSIIEIT
jgi:hypothetical protein